MTAMKIKTLRAGTRRGGQNISEAPDGAKEERREIY